MPFFCIFLGFYLLDADRKEIEESPEIDLCVEKEMAGANLEAKVW